MPPITPGTPRHPLAGGTNRPNSSERPSTDQPVTRGEEPDSETDGVPSAFTTALSEVSTTHASLLPTALLAATDTTPTRVRNRLLSRPRATRPLTAARRHRAWAWG
ncbi:hypothetical protein SGL43_05409 [Streptomyces globisporus]|uniref:Uncharacterized protein n=1 Tax=Streptomyces globisporus TaxID=1908 RepID=A0ABM9H409_STRGL|nr:hypothetical protein SGL43_05409 [Streptomyces globisporus]